MLRFSLGVTRMERNRNKVIRGTTQTGRLGEKPRETRLKWFRQKWFRQTVLSTSPL